MSTTESEAERQEGVVGQASSAVHGAASAAQEKAGELTEQGKSRLSQQLDRRTTDVGSQARQVAQALRESGDRMRDDGTAGGVGQMTTQVADQVERLGSYLEQRRGDELLHDVEEFARRRPWMIAGVGLLAGIAASRFLKASSEQRYGPSRRFAGQGATSPYPYGSTGSYGSTPYADTDVPLSRGVDDDRV